MLPLLIDPRQCRYRALIGTGGIGTGVFFALNGDHTLGREESRSGHFLDRHDYCKLHIICHYVKTLLGAGFATLPISQVGADAAGTALLAEMAEAGLDLRYVHVAADSPTLYALCFVYPDGSGGNLTVDDSACGHVDAALIAAAEPECAAYGREGIALAVPEVPLAARAALLAAASRRGLWRAASFTSEELAAAEAMGLLAQVDLLALNRDEAAALAGLPATTAPSQLAAATARALAQRYSQLQATITAGAVGSWAWDGAALHYLPAHPVPLASSAGAGDAHLAGLLAGLAAGLALAQAHELAALVAALSVTSPHTIHKGIDRASLAAFAAAQHVRLDRAVAGLLGLG